MDKRIGAQGYTIRDFIKTPEDFEESLRKLHEIGYQTIQLSGLGPIPAETVRDLCKKYRIEPVCTHKGEKDYLENLDETIKFHQTIGCKIAGIGSMGSYDKTAEGVRKFVKDFTPVCNALKAEGLTFAYHNHAFDFIKDNGKYLLDIIIEESNFDLILDVYWVAFSGIDPAKLIRKLGSRARIIHFKDLACCSEDGVGNKVEMTEVMNGNLDWDSIIEACEEAGCQAAMVEQDICKGDPFESLRISYNNLKTKGFC